MPCLSLLSTETCQSAEETSRKYFSKHSVRPWRDIRRRYLLSYRQVHVRVERTISRLEATSLRIRRLSRLEPPQHTSVVSAIPRTDTQETRLSSVYCCLSTFPFIETKEETQGAASHHKIDKPLHNRNKAPAALPS